jgi:hypothetical protein
VRIRSTREVCPACGALVDTYVPPGGDGLAGAAVPHTNRAGAPCPGSNRIVDPEVI